MQYASETEICKDLIIRTRENLELIENHPGAYEVTQLINSFVGLLIIPKETVYPQITDAFVDRDILDKLLNCIIRDGYSQQTKDLKTYVRHLRNAVAHGGIEIKAEKPVFKNKLVKIISIKFTDKDTRKKTNPEFATEIGIELLRSFVIQFSDAVLKIL